MKNIKGISTTGVPIAAIAAAAVAVGADGRIYVAGDTSIHVHGPEGRKPFEIALDGPPRPFNTRIGRLPQDELSEFLRLAAAIPRIEPAAGPSRSATSTPR